MELVLCEIEDDLQALSGHVAARIVGCLFLKRVKSVIKERDTLEHHLEELGDDLWDTLKEERQLLRGQVAFLENFFAAVRESLLCRRSQGRSWKERCLQHRRWWRCPGSMRGWG